MNIIITGANLINKGAQSMLFVTVDQLTRYFPDANIFYATYRGDSVKEYTFKRLYWDPFVKNLFIYDKHNLGVTVKQELINITKYVLRKTPEYNSIKKSADVIKKASFIVDISGYALSDKWGYEYNEGYLDNIRIAKKLGIPIFLMPQSFGPFEYKNMNSEKANILRNDIKNLLPYCSVIFAREIQSKENLRELDVNKVIISHDLVLQTACVDYKNVIRAYKGSNLKSNLLLKPNSIAIIPNQQIAKRGYKDLLVREYAAVVEVVKQNNYNVYIVKHSGEDDELCQYAYKELAQNYDINYINADMECYEYSELVKGFSLVISSRFHAAVHAIKEDVPTIAIGWAVKYKELMESVGQGNYSIDITDNYTNGSLAKLAEEMIQSLSTSKEIIRESLNAIQSNSCFDTVFNEMGR